MINNLMSDIFSRNDQVYPKRCKYCGAMSAYLENEVGKNVKQLRCEECGNLMEYKSR
jgi:translation initiation factor 2 beta subunit (eIF-2beta)/eIF-5